MQDELEGVEVDIVDDNDHVEEADSTIRSVKEVIRGTL